MEEGGFTVGVRRRGGIHFQPLPPARPCLSLLFTHSPHTSLRLKRQRHPVHAVPQPRRAGPVREDVPQVPAACRAVDLCPRHERDRPVDLLRHRALDGREKGGPPRARVELGAGLEQGGAAPGAGEDARPLLAVEEGAAGPLRARLAQDAVGFGGEGRLPLGVRGRERALGATGGRGAGGGGGGRGGSRGRGRAAQDGGPASKQAVQEGLGRGRRGGGVGAVAAAAGRRRGGRDAGAGGAGGGAEEGLWSGGREREKRVGERTAGWATRAGRRRSGGCTALRPALPLSAFPGGRGRACGVTRGLRRLHGPALIGGRGWWRRGARGAREECKNEWCEV